MLRIVQEKKELWRFILQGFLCNDSELYIDQMCSCRARIFWVGKS